MGGWPRGAYVFLGANFVMWWLDLNANCHEWHTNYKSYGANRSHGAYRAGEDDESLWRLGIVDIITGCAGDVHPVKCSIRSNDAGYLSSRGAGYLLTWNLFHPSVR